MCLQPLFGKDRREFGERFAGRRRARRLPGRRRAVPRCAGPPQRRIAVGPFAAGDVGGLVAFESEVGILAVVGQLAGDSGERGNGIDDDPADRLVDVRGMPAHRHGRMAGGGDCLVLELEAGVADRQSQGGVRLEQGLREPVVAAQDPGGGVGRQFIGISTSASSTIVMSCVGLRQRSTISRYAARVASSAAAGRMATSLRSPSTWPIDGAVSRASSSRNRSNCGSTSSKLRLGGGLELERRRFSGHVQHLGLESIGGGQGERGLQCEFLAGLDLAQHAGYFETAVGGLLDLDRVKAQVGRAGAFHPLFEEPLEVLAGKPVPVARGCRRSRPWLPRCSR